VPLDITFKYWQYRYLEDLFVLIWKIFCTATVEKMPENYPRLGGDPGLLISCPLICPVAVELDNVGVL
jgi:hypothetical protein